MYYPASIAIHSCIVQAYGAEHACWRQGCKAGHCSRYIFDICQGEDFPLRAHAQEVISDELDMALGVWTLQRDLAQQNAETSTVLQAPAPQLDLLAYAEGTAPEDTL